MIRLPLLGFVFGTSLAVVATGCAAEPSSSDETPDLASDTLGETDIGTSYNGWTQSFGGSNCARSHTVSGTGDATRGGGACYVISDSTATCTIGDDSNCLGIAHSRYGSDAYGYCAPLQWSGPRCFYRPGSQADYCALSPSRASGSTLTKTTSRTGMNGFLGCMTKSAGPNTACGGTNQSLYMRDVTLNGCL